MITPARRTIVSIVSFAALLAIGACARVPAPVTWDPAAAATGEHPTIRFENEAETYVDVYLVAEQREWRLGRVAPGVRANLRVPDGALRATLGFAQLAVVAGGPLTLAAARDPRAIFTVAQPATSLLSQGWRFSHSPLASPQLLGARANGMRR